MFQAFLINACCHWKCWWLDFSQSVLKLLSAEEEQEFFFTIYVQMKQHLLAQVHQCLAELKVTIWGWRSNTGLSVVSRRCYLCITTPTHCHVMINYVNWQNQSLKLTITCFTQNRTKHVNADCETIFLSCGQLLVQVAWLSEIWGKSGSRHLDHAMMSW